MTANKNESRAWHPLNENTLNEIDDLFAEIFPIPEYGNLSEDISEYWIGKLERTWEEKPERVRNKDLAFKPDDPLSRVLPSTVVIAYPDSVHHENQPTLEALERFLDEHFPGVTGLHILPACSVVEERFNDGYFSQVKRDRIHRRFGTNALFSRLVEKYFSMADFVLNHVDIENSNFRAYLDGDDDAGDLFYVFSENHYQRHKAAGAFDRYFRPRPFPLFTIFRRAPEDDVFHQMDFEQRCDAINDIMAPDPLDPAIVKIFTVFEKIRNDQSLLDDDYANITVFLGYLRNRGIQKEAIFRLSRNQESSNPPYIFKHNINKRSDLLLELGYGADDARRIANRYESFNAAVFGEQIRALTTFSHVQVDVNTSTFAGLKMIADDFFWYLGLDLNMLRLDAAHYAFKKFHTPSFGLPEVRKLMRILYLSMDCVSPRIVANLEINDRLGVVLSQLADKESPPPMIYDFHLPGMLPVVFNTGDAGILWRIFDMISQYDTPRESIRFSVADSHDGKSVRGSMDLLNISERWIQAETVRQNGGRIKYKSVNPRRCAREEFLAICKEAGIDCARSAEKLFINPRGAGTEELVLKERIQTTDHIVELLCEKTETPEKRNVVSFFADKVINGREPYELCCSTRDSMIRLNDEILEARRFLGFYSLAFALMGRNVKSIYFNDMPGLPNDLERMQKTGEYRDIKRTRSSYTNLIGRITQPGNINRTIALNMNRLIAIVDSDMALHAKGNEAGMVDSGNPAVAVVHNHYGSHHSLAVVNTTMREQKTRVDLSSAGINGNAEWVDRITGKPHRTLQRGGEGVFTLNLSAFEHLWLQPYRD